MTDPRLLIEKTAATTIERSTGVPSLAADRDCRPFSFCDRTEVNWKSFRYDVSYAATCA